MNNALFPYEVIEEFVRGGCSIIYKIKGPSEDKADSQYVLKTMMLSEEDPQAHQRFYMEYEFLRAYPHPNLIKVKDYFADYNGSPAYVMEWIEGQTWADYWRERPVFKNLPLFLSLFKQLCTALDFIHKHQIIHRDLKPQNVLINSDDTLKLIDFGIMKVADLTMFTHRNTFMGSAYYVSPEGISGEAVNHTADVFALGVMLYDIFTGMKPFKGPTLGETIYQRLVKKPQTPSQIAEVPEELDRIILKMLARDPRDRYQSCDVIYKEVESVFSAYKPRPKPEDLPTIDVLTKGALFHSEFIVDCEALLQQKRLLFLYGDSGSGKTTIVENLCAQHFDDATLRLECDPDVGELDLIEAILRPIKVTSIRKKHLEPWIDILGNAFPSLNWTNSHRDQKMGHSTVLSAFHRVLFGIEDPMILVIEGLHEASSSLRQFVLQLAQSVKRSANKSIHMILTAQNQLDDFSNLGVSLGVPFPDVITMSEYLSKRFEGCRIPLHTVEKMVEMSGQNIGDFMALIATLVNGDGLVVQDGVLELVEQTTQPKTEKVKAKKEDQFDSTMPPQLRTFTPEQIQQCRWIALCPDGLDLNILRVLTGHDLTSLGQTIDAADEINIFEYQSGTTEGFRWKNAEIRDYLVRTLPKEERIKRYRALGDTIEAESRQFLSYSPALWILLARIYHRAENERKAAEYALSYTRYCFQNANYEPIRKYMKGFTKLQPLQEQREFWYMLGMSFAKENLPLALEYAEQAKAIQEDVQTLSLAAILHFYNFEEDKARDFLRLAFAQKNLSDMEIHLASRLVGITIILGENDKSRKLLGILEKKLKGRSDLFATDTLLLAHLRQNIDAPKELLKKVHTVKKQVLPKTNWKLKQWACLAYQETFNYNKALACLKSEEQEALKNPRYYRELLFLHLNFQKMAQVKNIISAYKQQSSQSSILKQLDPLFQLATEILLKDPKVLEVDHILSHLKEAGVSRSAWLTLITTVHDIQHLKQSFLEEVVQLLERAAVPWARHQMLRLKILALLKAGHHIELVYLFQKAVRKAGENGLAMEMLRLRVLRDFLAEKGLIPEQFTVEIPKPLWESSDAVQFVNAIKTF